MAYVPPHLRKRVRVESRPKRSEQVSVAPQLSRAPVKSSVSTTIEDLFEQIRLEDYGKADGAWFGDDRS